MVAKVEGKARRRKRRRGRYSLNGYRNGDMSHYFCLVHPYGLFRYLGSPTHSDIPFAFRFGTSVVGRLLYKSTANSTTSEEDTEYPLEQNTYLRVIYSIADET